MIPVSFCALLLHHMPLHCSLLAPCCQYWINFSLQGTRYFTHFSRTGSIWCFHLRLWLRLSKFLTAVFSGCNFKNIQIITRFIVWFSTFMEEARKRNEKVIVKIVRERVLYWSSCTASAQHLVQFHDKILLFY